MLRPEKMARVSVTGAKREMAAVVEAVHGLNLLHVDQYDDSWEGFDPGEPIEGAESLSETLVTVRSIESQLDLDPDEVEQGRRAPPEPLEERLAEVREEVNELADEREAIDDELRDVEAEIEATEPFVELGVDLDLLRGYDSLQVAVGEGRREPIADAVEAADDLGAHEIFPRGTDRGVLAVFARPTAGASRDALTDALVGTEFATIEVPAGSASPEAHVDELESRAEELEAELDAVEDRLAEIREREAEFLLAAEEALSIEVQKTEAPLSFATTENAFVAEGWIPADEYSRLEAALRDAVGDHVDIDRLEVAEYTRGGDVHRDSHADPEPARGEATDGGTAAGEEPPVVQRNPDVVSPFEILVRAVARPEYSEFDPTVLLFLTFPAFFGFMIGDVGYGIIYAAIGWHLYSNVDSRSLRSMGGVTLFAAGFTILFGILYGEVFGLHLITEHLWVGALGLEGPVLEKGLSPAALEWALGWLVVSVLAGIVHLNLGFVLDFVENAQLHDLRDAVLESGSWILMLNGIWVWIFSRSMEGTKPEFIYTVFAGEPFSLGFGGFPPAVGLVGAALFGLGIVLLVLGEPIEVVESLNVLVNALSYTRLAAVLLAKAGMAFTVNLLFFGAYTHHGEFHFMLSHGPEHVVAEYGREAIMFPGLVHSGIGGLLGGLVVLVLGHLLVLALGITSAGLQAVRLEYVEFFGKFYSGGGREYEPFGYERRFTTED